MIFTIIMILLAIGFFPTTVNSPLGMATACYSEAHGQYYPCSLVFQDGFTCSTSDGLMTTSSFAFAPNATVTGAYNETWYKPRWVEGECGTDESAMKKANSYLIGIAFPAAIIDCVLFVCAWSCYLHYQRNKNRLLTEREAATEHVAIHIPTNSA